jgi:hypothetical protein
MEQNSHERTSRWKMYEKRLFFEDLEVRDTASKKDFGFCYKEQQNRIVECPSSNIATTLGVNKIKIKSP